MKIFLMRLIIISSFVISCLSYTMQQQLVEARIVNNSTKFARIYFADNNTPVLGMIMPGEQQIIKTNFLRIMSTELNIEYFSYLCGPTYIPLYKEEAIQDPQSKNWKMTAKTFQAFPYTSKINFFIAQNGNVSIFHSQQNFPQLTPYEILGIKKPTNADEIKQAYQKLIFKFHPDKHNNSLEITEIYRFIFETYEKLIDEESKKESKK